MNRYRKQAEEKLGSPVIAGAFFMTPGADFAGDTRIHAMIERIGNLFWDESSMPRVRDEDTVEGYAGQLYIAATQTEIAVFTIEATLWNYILSDVLIRCLRNQATSISYSKNSKTKVAITTSGNHRHTLITQDAPENVAGLVQLFGNCKLAE